MEIFRTLTPAETPSAVALGSFDGIHRGHREVISRALAAESRGLTPTVFTFTENPKAGKDTFGGLLLTQEEKIRILSEMGVKRLYLVEFESIRPILPEDFVSNILADVCRAKLVCCGFNFTFGKDGRAGSRELRSLCAAQGIETSVAEPVFAEGGLISSTRIRNLLADGKPEEAAHLLGRPFAYESPVIAGRRLGRELGTPTLNQAVPPELVRPKFGVYVSAVSFGDTITFGVTNVGVKPTVGSNAVLAETWMPAYHGPELYGKIVRTALLKFLRPERKFGSLEELKAAIQHNGEQAERYFREHPELFDSRR
ncbi:riboflavin biosynthesis protein RibF [Thermocaproicibacter melissae]|jgi:riboflavin kinase / FMN adenylyltransferase|uniref:riboflavin biosynthesis protein RibF n=1 Tax=Thermocaproicibacter melissae TaxID=2966552 RepID=UPI0024B2780A|nr:riboflavin biosynthesis protein RibF [Thermocaproicibacter melissae]WBY64405.1 riboflavin biosynthesis protein RibF [Thermocaproicibacter melissae]